MQCICGGTFIRRTGQGKRGPYDFWGCDGFKRGCKQSLNPDEYDDLERKGLTKIVVAKERKPMTKIGHKAYTPKQRVNKDSAVEVHYRKMTDEQEAAIAAALPGNRRIRTNADAGTGKSSMLLQFAARTKPLKGELTTGIVVAFNAKPAREIAAQLPFNWVGATLHQCGNDACAAKWGVNKMGSNDYKTKDILIDLYGPASELEQQQLNMVATNLVELCKAMVFTDTTDNEIILAQAHKYNMDLGDAPNRACDMAKEVLRVGSTAEGITKYGHDFNDMIYLPVVHNLPVAQYRYVAVDEAQDCSPARMHLAMMLVAPGGTLIIVGDERQCIYFFTYADIRSMDTFGELMGDATQNFPLTLNWRCPSIVVELARILCPSIRARPNAPRGAIHEISTEDFQRIVVPGDLVLCRVNADLIHECYGLIKQGIGAVVLGRDIGLNLKNIIEKLGKDKTNGGYLPTLQFLARLNAWYDAETDALAAKNLRNPERLFQKLDDDYGCIIALCGVEVAEDGSLGSIGIATVQGVLDKIDKMFGEETDGAYDPDRVVTFATVHKVKGGQRRRVFILRAAENHPHPMAVSDDEITSEKWVLNVAATRCGDGTSAEGQALFFVECMPAWYRDKGGAELITVYEGAMR